MVVFAEAIKSGFRNYFNFKGRSTRAELWWWVLFTLVTGFALAVVDSIIGTSGKPEEQGFLEGLFGLFTLLPTLALGTRRLHDINRSGWWMFLLLAIFVGWFVLLLWSIRKGDQNPNKYGSDPYPKLFVELDLREVYGPQ